MRIKGKMKLDQRIINRKYIFDVFNADKAEEYIGEECYMTNDFPLFEDLDVMPVYTLDSTEYGFYNEEEDLTFDFCLPVRFAKPVEKRYKPFDPETFEQHYGIGSVIKYRRKDEKHITYKAIVQSRVDNEDSKEVYFVIRKYSYTLDELFKYYEICEYGEWKPFGVEVQNG
jgi:hypothetical protein